MIPLGLNADALRNLMAALMSSGAIQIRAELLDLSHNHLEHLTDRVLGGQIDVDVDGTNTIRQLSISLADPNRNLPFDSDSPATLALFMDRMILVIYEVHVGNAWVSIPVFCGPIASNLVRQGDNVSVTCYSKDYLAQGAAWHPTTYKKAHKKTDVLTAILNDLAGEAARFIDIPDLPAKLPKDFVIHRTDQPWKAALQIAHSMNRQLFYDAHGRARLRSWPGNIVYHFTEANAIVGPLQITYSGDIVNTVEVIGATPKGAKNPLTAVSIAPLEHPLSPQRLGRNGVGRYLLKGGTATTNSNLKTQKECQDLADRLLKDALVQQVNVEFQCLPGILALMEPGDLVHASGDDGAVTFRLRKFSLPLKAEESGSVGFFRNAGAVVRRRHVHNSPKPRRHHHK